MRLREFAQATSSRCSAEVLAGRYRLDAPLGSGGAADVHRGFDLRLRRPVAVKIFRPDAGVGMEEASHSEAVILARLHHPGLVTAYDAGRHDGRAFLVMQLIQGETLKSLIADGPLSPEATAAIGADLAHALAHAHETGIVHRDVKPSNILLDARNRPHLADFGISRLLGATAHTATGTLIGTAAYLSPEQVLGEPVGRPADIYALGLVLLECLTGRLEYDGGPIEVAIARLHRPPAVPDWLPERLRVLLREMTDLDQQNRPTARHCAHALMSLVDEVHTSPGSSASATRPVSSKSASRTPKDTHTNPMPRAKRTAPPTTPARGRGLMAGAAIALAAVTATTLSVTGSSAPQHGGRSASEATGAAPAGEEEPSGSAGQRKPDAAPTAGPPSQPAASDGRRPGHEDGQTVRLTPEAPRRERAVDGGAPSSSGEAARATPAGRASAGTAPSDRAAAESHSAPGQAGKAGEATNNARRERPGEKGPRD
ncbi:serine/threonine protein kinase [Streptomyces sp. JH34]|uniref:serine/threonine protein kinase n=1 Tax=Streptomyces sp. JH34 TaxID=2793633 RepID=UPI0023FA2CB2|nr:serine/threonine protein kinase [Streptomyces sp. JH34]MDF6017262.1 protein kinase [Streptomyces sp. JH34]